MIVKRRAPAGAAWPNREMSRFSGTTLCLTVSVPSGWSNTSVAAPGFARKRDHRTLAVGQLTHPVAGIAQRFFNSGSTSIRLRQWRLFSSDQRLVYADRNVPPEDFKRRFGFQMQRPRSRERAFDPDFEQIGRTALELQLRVETRPGNRTGRAGSAHQSRSRPEC